MQARFGWLECPTIAFGKRVLAHLAIVRQSTIDYLYSTENLPP